MKSTVTFRRTITAALARGERTLVTGPGVSGEFDLVEDEGGTVRPFDSGDTANLPARLSVDGREYLVSREVSGWTCAQADLEPVPAEVRARIRAVMDEVLARYLVDEGVQERIVYHLRRELDSAVFARSEAEENLRDAQEWLTSATADVEAASRVLEARLAMAASARGAATR